MRCRERNVLVLRAWGNPIPRGLILVNRHVPIETKIRTGIKATCKEVTGVGLFLSPPIALPIGWIA
jgi:hypothetical protein